jgi:hypothetical protein
MDRQPPLDQLVPPLWKRARRIVMFAACICLVFSAIPYLTEHDQGRLARVGSIHPGKDRGGNG